MQRSNYHQASSFSTRPLPVRVALLAHRRAGPVDPVPVVLPAGVFGDAPTPAVRRHHCSRRAVVGPGPAARLRPNLLALRVAFSILISQFLIHKLVNFFNALVKNFRIYLGHNNSYVLRKVKNDYLYLVRRE